MATLTPQDKLALALTSYPSQRAMAASMGISHQRLGRWLKQGYEGGVKRIPADTLTQQGIDAFYRQHVRNCNAQSKREGLPSGIPVFFNRPTLKIPNKKGEYVKGQRIIVNNTHHIRNNLRTAIVQILHSTGKYVTASVQSIIDMALYNARAQDRYNKLGESLFKTDDDSNRAAAARKAIKEALKLNKKLTGDSTFTAPIYTKMVDIRPDSNIEAAVSKLNDLLRNRHEPATGARGTLFQSAFLFQLATPRPQNEQSNVIPIGKARAKRPRNR